MGVKPCPWYFHDQYLETLHGKLHLSSVSCTHCQQETTGSKPEPLWRGEKQRPLLPALTHPLATTPG